MCRLNAMELDSLAETTPDQQLCENDLVITRKWCSTGDRIVAFCRKHKAVLLGQGLSFLLACSGAASATLHFECSLSAPACTSGLFYAVLALHLIPMYTGRNNKNSNNGLPVAYTSVAELSLPPVVACCEDKIESWFLGCIPLAQPWYLYLIIAFLDVQANYVTVMAFRYTTLTSISLFDAMAIPSAMLFSRCLMSRRHTGIHLLGVTLCMIGVGSNALADFETDESDGDELADFPLKMRGDVLAALGGILFGVVNVASELLLAREGDSTEYLGLLGFFGAIVAFVQAAFLERDAVIDVLTGVPEPDGKVCSVESGMLLVGAFVLANVLGYIGTSKFLLISEATLFNLSLLTGDLWSVAFTAVAEKIVPPLLFWGALASIVVGVVIYETAPSPIKR